VVATLYGGVCVCVWVCVCACARVCVCVRASVCVAGERKEIAQFQKEVCVCLSYGLDKSEP